MDKQFQAKVTVDSKGKVQGTVIDNSMGKEYLLLRSVSPGPFASEVIAGYQQVLKDTSKHCFLDVPFKSAQANRIAKQIEEKFGDWPEHIFQNLPHYAVFREPKTLEEAMVIIRKQEATIKNLEAKFKEQDIKILELSETIKLLTARMYGKKVKF